MNYSWLYPKLPSANDKGNRSTLNGVAVNWMSKKPKTVAKSIAEAEYVALTEATSEDEANTIHGWN
jgi:hypothetical protein